MARKADSIISESRAVKAAIAEILQTAGISDELLAKRIQEGLDATIVLRETKYSPREAVVNFRERREMVELALRVKGLLAPEQQRRAKARLTWEELLEESHHG